MPEFTRIIYSVTKVRKKLSNVMGTNENLADTEALFSSN